MRRSSRTRASRRVGLTLWKRPESLPCVKASRRGHRNRLAVRPKTSAKVSSLTRDPALPRRYKEARSAAPIAQYKPPRENVSALCTADRIMTPSIRALKELLAPGSKRLRKAVRAANPRMEETWFGPNPPAARKFDAVVKSALDIPSVARSEITAIARTGPTRAPDRRR